MTSRATAAKLGKAVSARRSVRQVSAPIVPNPPGAAKAGSVVMQARVEADFARTLLEEDALVLGLDGASALVREGLRLVHERAREAAMIAAYDDFYEGQRAPLPAGVVPATDE